ncbi:MAG: hypothetical protein Kow0063_09830 [Anaerolineae bacterium]
MDVSNARRVETTGYLHPDYARSLAEYGVPRELPRCQGWILERAIPGTTYRDAMGPYPLFLCQDWSQLHADLEDWGSDAISLAVVTDPFGTYDLTYLRRCFGDVVIPYKQHFVVDLSQSPGAFVSRHHQRYARKALREIRVERCPDPVRAIDEWTELYAHLIERHNINGLARFSRAIFEKQLSVPGMVALRAVHAGTTVGMTLWYIHGDAGYYHLGAYSPAGYKLRASFALFWSAIAHFADTGLRWLNLGAGAGVKESKDDGLRRFKRGWATGVLTAYFCGRVFDRDRYLEIVKLKEASTTDYFPAYRQGEF